MCELKVIVKGEIVFKDAVYVKVYGSKVVVKDILGDSKEFENYRITEVDVNKDRLVLSPSEQ